MHQQYLDSVNNGGAASIIRLDDVAQLEQPAAIGAAGRAALALWQARRGEVLTVADAAGNWYRARIDSIGDSGAVAIPFAPLSAPESPLRLGVFQALPHKERFELVLQKLTEIGVTDIIPFTCTHSTTVEQRDSGQKKSHRWPDVLLRAAKQCRRGVIPRLYPAITFEQVVESLACWEVKVLLAEKDTYWTLAQGLGNCAVASAAIVVGPEGGFAADEITAAQNCGAVPVTLGERILRTETAAIVAAALTQHLVGDYA